MIIGYELDLNNFEAWSGAVSTLERIKDAGKTDEAEQLLEEFYPDGMTETRLNDLLWFEDEWLFECLGIADEDEDED